MVSTHGFIVERLVFVGINYLPTQIHTYAQLFSTGKTLTAEAVAELLKKPLYVVTAGDLGTTASELEKSLGVICSTSYSISMMLSY